MIYCTAALKSVIVQSLQNEHIVIALKRCESGHSAFCCHLSKLLKCIHGDRTELLNAVTRLNFYTVLIKTTLAIVIKFIAN